METLINVYNNLERNYQNDNQNVIYCFYNNNTNLYKIGITSYSRVLKRHSELQNQNGVSLTKVAWVVSPEEIGYCVKQAEQVIHDYFKDKRKIGEWFDFNKRDLSMLKNMFWELDPDAGSYLINLKYPI